MHRGGSRKFGKRGPKKVLERARQGGGSYFPYILLNEIETMLSQLAKGLKFVDWYHLGCYNIKWPPLKLLAVSFKILSKKWQELSASPLIY